MNLNIRDVQQHVTILGWLLIVGHAIFLLVGGFVFALLLSIGAVSGDSTAFAVLGIVGTAVALLLAILALPGIAAGIGLLKGTQWGRVLAMVVAVLSLLNFPVGTAIACYTFWVLLQPTANDYFAAPHPLPA